MANAADAEQAEDVAATAVGLRDEELQVEDVAVRILPQPAEPQSAAATFDLVRVRGGEAVDGFEERVDKRLDRIETNIDRLIQLYLDAETTQPAARRAE